MTVLVYHLYFYPVWFFLCGFFKGFIFCSQLKCSQRAGAFRRRMRVFGHRRLNFFFFSPLKSRGDVRWPLGRSLIRVPPPSRSLDTCQCVLI